MLAEALVLVALPLILIAAGVCDLASFTIPNFLQALLVGSFLAFAAATHLGPSGLLLHILAGAIGLAIGFALFALGYIGGGDAKLYAALLLWLGLKDFLPYTMVATLFGGCITLFLVALRRLPLPGWASSQAWLTRLHDGGAGVPYGVALAAGAFAVLPGTEIFRLAAGG